MTLTKRSLLCVPLFFFMITFSTGCTRPQVVVDAGAERDESVRTYVENTEVREKFFIDKIYQAEERTIDSKLKHEVYLVQEKYTDYLNSKTDATGKIALADVVEANKDKETALKGEESKANAFKIQALKVRELLIAAGEKNKVNLIIATKLNNVIKAFDGAEVETGLAAQEALDELTEILKTLTAKEE